MFETYNIENVGLIRIWISSLVEKLWRFYDIFYIPMFYIFDESEYSVWMELSALSMACFIVVVSPTYPLKVWVIMLSKLNTWGDWTENLLVIRINVYLGNVYSLQFRRSK